MKRRDFMKLLGVAAVSPLALAEGKKVSQIQGKNVVVSSPEIGTVKAEALSGVKRNYFKNKIFAVPKSEKTYLNYYGIKQTTQKPLLRILSWENNLKYVYLPLDEIRRSNKTPLPRYYVEFESNQPIGIGDLIKIDNQPEWVDRGKKEFIIVQVQPLFI